MPLDFYVGKNDSFLFFTTLFRHCIQEHQLYVHSKPLPEISLNLLKNAFIFSITVSLFCVLSPVPVNLETGGSILAKPVPVV